MKFINAQEFLKQPKEVQKVFLDWWKPEFGDLYCNLYNGQENTVLVVNKCQMEMTTFVEDIKIFGVPLLTESKLRQFIEEKVNKKIDIINYLNTGYSIIINAEIEFNNLGKDLLQALWQVACEIAEKNSNKKES